jgi:hypothetical protein
VTKCSEEKLPPLPSPHARAPLPPHLPSSPPPAGAAGQSPGGAGGGGLLSPARRDAPSGRPRFCGGEGAGPGPAAAGSRHGVARAWARWWSLWPPPPVLQGLLLGAARSWPAGLDLGLVGPVALTPLPSPSWPPVYAAVARLGLMVSAEQRVVRPARWPGSGGPA